MTRSQADLDRFADSLEGLVAADESALEPVSDAYVVQVTSAAFAASRVSPETRANRIAILISIACVGGGVLGATLWSIWALAAGGALALLAPLVNSMIRVREPTSKSQEARLG